MLISIELGGYLFMFFFVLRAGWNRIFSLSLFVEHMLLGIEQLEEKLAPLVLEHTRGLGQVGSLY